MILEIIQVVLVIAFLFVIGCAILDKIDSSYDDGYKQGQVDALLGKIKYHKVENEDKELVWEEIEDEQNTPV